MKYLVTRIETTYPREGWQGRARMRHTDYWPMIVEMTGPDHNAESVVQKALDRINQGYVPKGHEFLVVPLHDAVVVAFDPPKPTYEVTVRQF